MTIWFKRLTILYPKPNVRTEDPPGCWKIYTICTAADKRTCTTVADVNALKSKADQDKARKAFISFYNKADTGLPITDLYDNDQCHETHSYTRKDGSEVKILRVRLGDIRINFFYLSDKNIVILKTWAKRKDSLSDGEKRELKDLAEQVLNCISKHPFEERLI